MFAAAYGLSASKVPEIAKALEEKLAMHPVLWLQGGSCTGCSVSFLNVVDPDIKKVLLDPVVPGHQLSVKFHPNVSAAAGDVAINAIEDTAKNFKGKFVLVVEGSVPLAEKGAYCDVGEIGGKPVPFTKWMNDLGKDAALCIAIGTCSAYGGIPAGAPNPTQSVSLNDYFKSVGIKTPVLNVPGCPPHPDWFVLAVAGVLINGLPKASDLDQYGRLLQFHGKSIHDYCTRRKQYDEGVFAEKYGDEGCLATLGCKGPITNADCPTRKWNGGVNYCIGAGAPCISCCEPGFPDASSPFYAKLPDETLIRYGYKAKKEDKANV